MPIISAYADHPTRPYVRVEIDWADVPAATHAGVSRVDVATGECTPLRPYICYTGWELLLSCGHGTFWDTEAPFDTPFYYVTTSSEAPCIPAIEVYDLFQRVTASGWGTATSGQTWTATGGVAANFSTTGTRGRVTMTSTAVARRVTIDGPLLNVRETVTLFPNVVATGASFQQGLMARRDSGANNEYIAEVLFDLLGAMSLRVRRNLGGSLTTLATFALDGVYDATSQVNLEFLVQGSTLSAKAWLSTLTQPADYQIVTTDTNITAAGAVGTRSILSGGTTNVDPPLEYDDLYVYEPCAPCVAVTADTSSTPITITNDGGFWLKDPVRPCNDRPVPLCQTAGVPGCGAEGILFVGIGPEVYASNSISLRPMNRRRTIAITRPRGDATTALRLQTLTFTDRDELLDLVEPGSPLLFQGPSEYGIPDRYMDIRDVQVSPELSDLRIQIRSETLPYNTVDRPAGATQGICGTRVADICDLYPTWDALAATGFTWDDLIRGAADPAIANPLRRTWDDVQSEFADWDAVEAGGRTWTGLLVGD